MNDEIQRQAIEAYNRRLLSIGGPQRALRLGDRQCTCPCRCDEMNGEQNDSDYEYDSEAEDDLNSHLSGAAVAAEQQMARTYGWRTNVISNQDSDDERNMFYEAPGHYTMARTHNIAIPQESSLANSENTVGRVEAESLGKALEPWELEAVHQSTGRPYSSLLQPFPEARSMQLPTNWHLDEPRQTGPTCPHCGKNYSEEFLEWAQGGDATFCESCGLAETPDVLAEDPDVQVFNVDFRRAMDNCYCRCECATDVTSRPASGEAAPREASMDSDTSSRPANGEASFREVSMGSNTSSLPTLEEASPNPNSPSEASTPLWPVAEPPEEVGAFRQWMREIYDLPELRFSDDSNVDNARRAEVRMALEDMEVAISFKSYGEAFAYAHVAAYLAPSVYPMFEHPIQQYIRQQIEALSDRIDQEAEAERANQREEDVEMEDTS